MEELSEKKRREECRRLEEDAKSIFNDRSLRNTTVQDLRYSVQESGCYVEGRTIYNRNGEYVGNILKDQRGKPYISTLEDYLL